MGSTPILVPPAASSRRSMIAKAAMDADSPAMATGIQIHRRWPSTAKDAVSAARSATPATASAARAKAAAAARATRFLLRR